MGSLMLLGALASAAIEAVAVYAVAHVLASRMRRAEIIERRVRSSEHRRGHDHNGDPFDVFKHWF